MTLLQCSEKRGAVMVGGFHKAKYRPDAQEMRMKVEAVVCKRGM